MLTDRHLLVGASCARDYRENLIGYSTTENR